MNTSRKAFTLIELIVVLAIIAILLVLMVPRVTGYVQDARVTAAQSNAAAVMDAAELYLIDQDRQGKDLANITLRKGGELDPYISRLSKKDHYEITIHSNNDRHYQLEGFYQKEDTKILIPSLEIGTTNSSSSN